MFVLKPLSEEALKAIVKRTKLKVPKDAFDWLLGYSNGDARKAIGMLEGAQELYGKVTAENLGRALESPNLRYDKKGEEHYDTISAFIKSMRASLNPTRLISMISRGWSRRARIRSSSLARMVVFASEDIGLAQPTALVVANAVFRACETIGYPECAINLAHGVAYLTSAKKNRCGLQRAPCCTGRHRRLRQSPQDPKKIRNPETKLMKDLGYGEGVRKDTTKESLSLPDTLKREKVFKIKSTDMFRAGGYDGIRLPASHASF